MSYCFFSRVQYLKKLVISFCAYLIINKVADFQCHLRFATTLHFYSNKAYNYVRQFLVKSLPHPLTISKWYRIIDTTSGINPASIKALKLKSETLKNSNGNKPVLYKLVVDEIDLKEKVETVSGKEYGYITRNSNCYIIRGKGIDNDDETPKATAALISMIVCANGKFKILVSHYFIITLTGEEKAEIVIENLIAIHESGSFTFDGLKANSSMCDALGAQLSLNDKAFFPPPVTKKPVFIVFDGCHCSKLL